MHHASMTTTPSQGNLRVICSHQPGSILNQRFELATEILIRRSSPFTARPLFWPSLSTWCMVNDGLMYANPLAMPVFSIQQHWHSHCHTKLYIRHSVTDNALVLVQHWSDGCRPDRAERVPACSRGAELPELAGARSGLRTMIPQFKADSALVLCHIKERG
jgi:hypothetical protein